MIKSTFPQSPPTRIPLLSAEWRHLIAINYEINPVILKPFVPMGAELDFYQKKTFVSLVGFLFQNTKLFGAVPLWPFHSFEEVNLRFYIRKKVGREIRRAVCFIREIVPFSAIAWGASVLYNEPYVKYPMRHAEVVKPENNRANGFAYEWKVNDNWIGLKAQTTGKLQNLRKKSIEEFVFEHYWGYTKQRNGAVKEYRVEHKPWRYWNVQNCEVDKAIMSFYGEPFVASLKRKPHSAFVAEGSQVKVYPGQKV